MKTQVYTDTELMQAVRRYAFLLGDTPSAKRWQADAKHLPWLPHWTTVRNRFGGWNEALKAAGVGTHPTPQPKANPPKWRGKLDEDHRGPGQCPECGGWWTRNFSRIGLMRYECALGHKWSIGQ